MVKEHLRILFLPWVFFSDSFTLGRTEFWPYNTCKRSRIFDPTRIDYLDQFFGRFRESDGTALSELTMCTEVNGECGGGERSAFVRMRRAVHALIADQAISASRLLIETDGRRRPNINTNAFEIAAYELQPPERRILVTAGSVADFGYAFDELQFNKPFGVVGGSCSQPGHTGALLGRCLEVADEQLADRVFRSLEWFRMAHLNSSEYSDATKVLMMATAFEILLTLPRHEKTLKFAEEIERRVALPDARCASNRIGKKVENHTCVYWWATEFYELRSEIIHGDIVSKEKLNFLSTFSQIHVATIVFGQLIDSLLDNFDPEAPERKVLAADWAKMSGSSIENADMRLKIWDRGLKKVHQNLQWL